jgi:hypothetical protein
MIITNFAATSNSTKLQVLNVQNEIYLIYFEKKYQRIARGSLLLPHLSFSSECGMSTGLLLIRLLINILIY